MPSQHGFLLFIALFLTVCTSLQSASRIPSGLYHLLKYHRRPISYQNTLRQELPVSSPQGTAKWMNGRPYPSSLVNHAKVHLSGSACKYSANVKASNVYEKESLASKSNKTSKMTVRWLTHFFRINGISEYRAAIERKSISHGGSVKNVSKAHESRWKSADELDAALLYSCIDFAKRAYSDPHHENSPKNATQIIHSRTRRHFGYVQVVDDAVTGGKIIQISIRGTRWNDINDIKQSLLMYRSTFCRNDGSKITQVGIGSIHRGYLEVAKAIYPSLIEALEKELDGQNIRQSLYRSQIIFSGHSLGGAVAQIMALLMYFDPIYEFAQVGGINNQHNQIKVISLASPKVFPAFAMPVDQTENEAFPLGARNHVRFYHEKDIVPNIPPAFLGYSHFGVDRPITFDEDVWERVVSLTSKNASAVYISQSSGCFINKTQDEKTAGFVEKDDSIVTEPRKKPFNMVDLIHYFPTAIEYRRYHHLEALRHQLEKNILKDATNSSKTNF